MSEKGYKSKPVADGIYLLYGYAEECSIYLIVGEKRALLVDTGMGTGDLNKAIRRLTDLPVAVINTHGHVDHAAGNDQFPRVMMSAGAAADADGITEEQKNSLPRDEAEADVRRMRYEKVFVTDGQVLDLGGREVEVIFTPGHTPGCVCLIDRRSRVLFSGDVVGSKNHCTHMLAYVEWGPFSTVSIETLLRSLRRLEARDADFDGILTGHDDRVLEKKYMTQIIKMCERILDGTAEAFHPELPPQYGNITCWRVEEADTAIIYHDETIWDKKAAGE